MILFQNKRVINKGFFQQAKLLLDGGNPSELCNLTPYTVCNFSSDNQQFKYAMNFSELTGSGSEQHQDQAREEKKRPCLIIIE